MALLILDDEPMVRELLELALQASGYEVILAQNSADAIAVLDLKPPQHRALITDVNLGDDPVTGWDVARRAREIDPDLPIVYMSGASGHQWPSLGMPGSILVTKPFASTQIVAAIGQLLNKPNPALL
jgi:DNA-binding response OmpR family regulator